MPACCIAQVTVTWSQPGDTLAVPDTWDFIAEVSCPTSTTVTLRAPTNGAANGVTSTTFGTNDAGGCTHTVVATPPAGWTDVNGLTRSYVGFARGSEFELLNFAFTPE